MLKRAYKIKELIYKINDTTFLMVTDFTRQANSNTHQEKPNEKESKTYGLLKYFILILLVITFIVGLLYVRLVFRCRIPHS